MSGKRDPRPAAPLRDPEVPAYIQSKFDEAVEDLRRHKQQLRREEDRPRHSPSPYGRRQPSSTWKPRDRLRGEETGHRRSEASRRDHRQTEEYDPRDNWRSSSRQTEQYDPRGNETETNYHKFTCPQGFKTSPSSLAAFLDNLHISKSF